jgi:hypothetical protein
MAFTVSVCRATLAGWSPLHAESVFFANRGLREFQPISFVRIVGNCPFTDNHTDNLAFASRGLALAKQFVPLRYRLCNEARGAIQTAVRTHPYHSEKHLFDKTLSSRPAQSGIATEGTATNRRHGVPFEAGQRRGFYHVARKEARLHSV